MTKDSPATPCNSTLRADLACGLAFLVLGLLSLSWFQGAQFISVGDFAFPLDGGRFAANTRFIWDSDIGVGHLDARQLSFLWHYSLLAGWFDALGLGQAAYERFLFWIWFSFSGLSAYILARRVGSGPTGAMAGGLFYMMSFYALSIAWHLASGLLLPAYAYFPLIMALFMRACDTGFTPEAVAGLLLAWAALGFHMYANPALLVVHWTPPSLYLLYRMARPNGTGRLRLLFGFACTLLLFVLLNAYYLVPVVMGLRGELTRSSHAQLGFISEWQTLRLNSAPLTEQWATRGAWDVLGEYRDTPFHHWGQALSGALPTLFGFLLTALAVAALFRRGRSRAFWGLLLVLGFYLSKGVLPPLGELLGGVYTTIPPLMSAFRGTVQKWGMLAPLAMAPLLALALDGFLKGGKHDTPGMWRKTTLGLLAAAFIALYAWPFLSGTHIFPGSRQFPGARFTVPEDYQALSAIDRTVLRTSRLLSLPLTRNGNVTYTWQDRDGKPNGYTGGDFIRWHVDRPAVFLALTDVERGLVDELRSSPMTRQDLAVRLLGLENVGLVLVHKDWFWDFWKGHPWQFGMDTDTLDSFIARTGLEGPILLTDNLELYQVPEAAFLPRLYSPSQVILTRRLELSHDDAILQD